MSERFGKRCLLARRLAERGVRMVAVLHTSARNFTSTNLRDQHANLESGHRRNAAGADQPIAGLLSDLKARGLPVHDLHATILHCSASTGHDGRDYRLTDVSGHVAKEIIA